MTEPAQQGRSGRRSALRFFGAFLIFIGGLWAVLSGLCSAVFLLGDPQVTFDGWWQVVLIVGLPSLSLSLAVMILGLFVFGAVRAAMRVLGAAVAATGAASMILGAARMIMALLDGAAVARVANGGVILAAGLAVGLIGVVLFQSPSAAEKETG